MWSHGILQWLTVRSYVHRSTRSFWFRIWLIRWDDILQKKRAKFVKQKPEYNMRNPKINDELILQFIIPENERFL